jgi:hypothetical protein
MGLFLYNPVKLNAPYYADNKAKGHDDSTEPECIYKGIFIGF